MGAAGVPTDPFGGACSSGAADGESASNVAIDANSSFPPGIPARVGVQVTWRRADGRGSAGCFQRGRGGPPGTMSRPVGTSSRSSSSCQ
jgi:hypothetical protein